MKSELFEKTVSIDELEDALRESETRISPHAICFERLRDIRCVCSEIHSYLYPRPALDYCLCDKSEYSVERMRKNL